jgi:hypothetical protein
MTTQFVRPALRLPGLTSPCCRSVQQSERQLFQFEKANRRGIKPALPPHSNVVLLNFANVVLLNFAPFDLA